ncbi:MAG: hypothetical protein HZB65_04520 [Candidatus Aenigmarchaeota archaeon]|nr:hypothetical protein [Candidatus Aenigmarchaeota archaeon]
MKESFNDNSLRNATLNILMTKHPLSARDIYEIIKCDHVKLATYPAVYKTLKVMTREKKLIKHNRSFSINAEWIKELKQFAERVEEEYVHKTHLPRFDEIKDNESKTLVFDNLESADKYRKRLQMEYLQKKDSPPYIGFYKQFKSPLVHSEKSLGILTQIGKAKLTTYLVSQSNAPLNNWCAEYYRKSGVFVKSGVLFSLENETMVLGDVVVQIAVPKKLDVMINKIYSKVKRLEELNIPDFFNEIYAKNYSIKMILFKNREIAAQMRDRLLSFFNKRVVTVK